jgi:hypothetical protein
MVVKNVRSSGGTTVISFPSWFDFVDDSHERKTAIKDANLASRQLDKFNWSGIEDYKLAFELAERGWHEGAAKVNMVGEAMFNDLASMIRKPEVVLLEDPGLGIDIARFVEGDPSCWIHLADHIKRGSSRTIVRLVFNATASAAIPTDVIMARGATVAALVMMMEYAGAGIEVVSFIGTSENDERYEDRGMAVEMYTTVKMADQPIDVLTLAYALAHPATLRRFGFGVMEGLDPALRKALSIPGGYGYPCDASHQGDLYVPKATAGDTIWLNPDKARLWVLESLKAQGVALHV